MNENKRENFELSGYKVLVTRYYVPESIFIFMFLIIDGCSLALQPFFVVCNTYSRILFAYYKNLTYYYLQYRRIS